MIQHINRILPTALLSGIILLCGCGQSEDERFAPGGEDIPATGKSVPLNISLQGTWEYNAPDDGAAATRSGEPLLGEWAKVNSFDATRSVDKSGEPKIALMELRETPAPKTSRSPVIDVVSEKIYFRLIVFKKAGNGYVFQSVADYTANGTNPPDLKQGDTQNLSVGETYRIVAYSFNETTGMGPLPSAYTWNETIIPITDLSKDFLTFDSGDLATSAENPVVEVAFHHQLCRLSVNISVTGFDNNTYSGCTGVYIKRGGNSSSWAVGADAIAANTDNSVEYSIPDSGTPNLQKSFVRLVPFASARPITVHIGAITVGGKVSGNLGITSSQRVQLMAGRRYTMTVQLKKKVGIQLSPGEITLTGNGCTDQDKAGLSLLTWAEGNLKSTGDGSSNDYVWTTPTGYGYYYTWMSTYTGNTSQNNTDPCSKLNPGIYGSGWRTPTINEVRELSRCTDNQTLSNEGIAGLWFMNYPKGIFLPLAGFRSYTEGSGTSSSIGEGAEGYYWASDDSNSDNGNLLSFDSYYAFATDISKQSGLTVRCVKGNPE